MWGELRVAKVMGRPLEATGEGEGRDDVAGFVDWLVTPLADESDPFACVALGVEEEEDEVEETEREVVEVVVDKKEEEENADVVVEEEEKVVEEENAEGGGIKGVVVSVVEAIVPRNLG